MELIVGQVEQDSAETGKTGFVNYKNAVWHGSFFKILESIIPWSKVGYHFDFSDIKRWLFPLVFILSSDYEEQSVLYLNMRRSPHLFDLCRCTMALIRGLRGLRPCPVCLIPAKELSNLFAVHPKRTRIDTETILAQARERNAEGKEDLLKHNGMRDVDVSLHLSPNLLYAHRSF